MTIRIIAAAALAAATLTVSAPAADAWGLDICEDVKIKINNNAGRTVKVYDIDYYDYGSSKWRSEPTINRTLENGGYWRDERNLEKVENAQTRIRVQYKVLNANARWSGFHSAKSAKFVCTEGKSVTINVN